MLGLYILDSFFSLVTVCSAVALQAGRILCGRFSSFQREYIEVAAEDARHCTHILSHCKVLLIHEFQSGLKGDHAELTLSHKMLTKDPVK